MKLEQCYEEKVGGPGEKPAALLSSLHERLTPG